MIRCVSISYYFGPYASNYIRSELLLHARFRKEGNYYLNIFPKAVENCSWVDLFRKENYNLIFIDCKPLTFNCVCTLRSIFKQNKIDLIYVHFGGWDVPAKFAAPFTPTVWHQRMSVNLYTRKQRFYHNVMYKILGRFHTRHIAISDAVYKAITSLTHNDTYLIYDGIDFNRIGMKDTIYSKKNDEEPFKILLFAFSAIGKGLDIALAACEHINKKKVCVELLVVTQKNSDNYLTNHYHHLPAWLKVMPPTNNVYEYYRAADAFLSSSRSEGFCNALLEAIYCGLPVIYSDIPGTRWADNFKYSYMYATESADDLVRAIWECMSISQDMAVVEQNRTMAKQRYSIDKWENDVYNVLLESCNI